ncbi:MAG: N-acetylmuramoyl-L-alanine amidase [Acidimicrobiaceae bacterium]|nr:N-acetylmuramoyl-L-alanine amidase [Acidimicrobiaceae bacterium]
MARWPTAAWQPVPTDRTTTDRDQWRASGDLRPIAVTLHHQAGNGNPFPVYIARRVSAHVWIPKAGLPFQHVDTSIRAWHGVAHNAYSIGVETEGCAGGDEPLNEHQLDLFAELMQWATRTHGIPLRLSEAINDPGLNYHRARGGPATACPCDLRVSQRDEILRRAGVAAPSPPAPAAPAPAGPQPPPFPGQLLRQGSTGDAVRRFQQRMRDRGWRIAVDGIFGPETDRVVRQFQREKRIGVDGIVGVVTWTTAFRTDNVT